MFGFLLLAFNSLMLWINLSEGNNGLAVFSVIGVVISLFIIFIDRVLDSR